MPLSITCSCGAKLEIDEKFAGKNITCPDCRKELPTAPRPVEAGKTSGFAIASLLFALVGPFTLLAPLLAVVCGLIGWRSIKRHPSVVGGERIALAGLGLGALFSGLSVAAYFSPEVLRVDGIFREIEWAGKLDYSGKLLIERAGEEPKFTIERTRRSWGKTAQRLDPKFVGDDDLILIDPWNDACVVCLNMAYDHEGEEFGIVLDRARSRFLDSEVVNSFKGKIRKDDLKFEERDKKTLESPLPGMHVYEMLLDLFPAGPSRTFLMRVVKFDGQSKLYIVAGGTRSSRFARMEPELRQIVESYAVSP